MPQIYLTFLWHMHQPFYKDLATGQYKLPWTRMHALKDYYGMARLLEEFPKVRQTFNLVPSLTAQVAEYAAGEAADPFLNLALKPAEDLKDEERASLLRNSFHANPHQMIGRYPRYAELYEAANAPNGARRFGAQDFRDLQMWSQLAWFDEEFQAGDAEVREWIERGRGFTWADQKRMGEKQREIIACVLPEYEKLAASGSIEISTTPYYHPILPLLCDSDIAGVSHPGVPLPQRFRYPEDARRQLVLAREAIGRQFGAAPVGLWPSEGSVSDEALGIAADAGFQWAGTDSGVLARTLERAIPVEDLYAPYRWRHGGRAMNMIFRDHYLSDLVGFVYSKMDAAWAAEDFLRRIRENCAGMMAHGRDALVPIILDGENAWEYYHLNGRPFLRELYRRISEDGSMRAVTVSEALRAIEPRPLDRIFPGSWINANFDVWIGADEDNRAWAQLLRARQAFDEAHDVPEDRKRLALEELMIAEGSDWCWWYGPEHSSAHREEFDDLYRGHLANVYRFLRIAPPEELSRPILRSRAVEEATAPNGPVKPSIDGRVTSYFEWLGAGVYRVDRRSGSMHGKQFVVSEAFYGSDGENFYLRLDFQPRYLRELEGLEARLTVESPDGVRTSRVTIGFASGGATVADGSMASAQAGEKSVECAFEKILEVRVGLAAAGIRSGQGLRFQLSLWRGGLPMGAIPQREWLDMPTTDPAAMGD